MIYLQVKGGLGNQLFQYSASYYLAKKLGTDLCLDYSSEKVGKLLTSTGLKRSFSFRDIQLECFNLDPHRTTSSVLTFIIDKGIGKVFNGKGFTGKKIALELREDNKDCRDNNQIIFDAVDRNKDIILSGYWQNIHYIDPVCTDLLRQFRMRLDVGEEYKNVVHSIQACESVGVHVRRGDFVTLGWDKGADYYANAMNIARKSIPNVHFFFFSDDINWVKENLYDCKDSTLVSITEEHADVKEFSLLSYCKHQIISESTFGWWAAFLNGNKNKSVFIPYDCRGDIWKDGWHRIKYRL